MNNDPTENYLLESRIRRGKLIELTSLLERFIDMFIAAHFSKNRFAKAELISILASNLFQSENKRKIFFRLIKKHHMPFYEKNKTIFEKISSVYAERNVYAHHPVTTNAEAIKLFNKNGTSTFGKFDEDENMERTSPIKEFDTHCKNASDCTTTIRQLLEKMKYLTI